MLKIDNLTKKYGKKDAVKSLNLEVKPGEIFGFIGHNGAGKTTTIKAIVGIHDFDEGTILIDGKNIKTDDVECKKIMAYIPDNPDIYENITAIAYLNFISDMYDVSKEDRKALIEKYAKQFEIFDNLNDVISSYSHGMKQKLIIIGALIHKPKLLILDEPFVGLDPKAAFNVKQIMKELTDSGSSIFFSSHVLEVVEKLCDRVGIIKKGELVKIGTVEEIKGDSSLENVFLEMIADE